MPNTEQTDTPPEAADTNRRTLIPPERERATRDARCRAILAGHRDRWSPAALREAHSFLRSRATGRGGQRP